MVQSFLLAMTIYSNIAAGIALAEFSPQDPGRPTGARTVQFRGQKPLTDEEREKNRMRLGISKEQQSKIEALTKETDDQRREVFTQMRDKQMALWKLYDDYKFDRDKTRELNEEIIALHRRLGEITQDSEDKMRKVLNKDQFARLRQMIKEMWDARRQRREKPPGPPPAGAPRRTSRN